MKNKIIWAAFIAFSLFMPSCGKVRTNDNNINAYAEWPKKFNGTVTVTVDGETTSQPDKVIELVKESESKLTMIFLRSKFAPKMPEMDVFVYGVSYKINTNGSLKLTGDGLVPETRLGLKVPKYTVKGLTGTVTDKGLGVSLHFGPHLTSFSSGGVTPEIEIGGEVI